MIQRNMLLLVTLLICEVAGAQTVRRTIAVDRPGTLISHLTLDEAQKITHLTIAGIINAVDFKYMRADFQSLQVLDISKAEIRAYAGKSGTYPNDKFYIYPPNCVPAFAFCMVSNGDTLGMPALQEVYLSDKTKNIEDGAFKRCNSLRICRIDKRTPPNLLKGGLNSGVTAIFVPDGCADVYRAKTTWAPFACLDTPPVRLHVVLPVNGGLQNAVGRAGHTLENVHFLTIEGQPTDDDLVTLSKYMTNLVEVDLTDATLTEIPEFEFTQKKNLLRVYLPRTVRLIGQRAFSGCTRLVAVVATGGIRIELGYDVFGDGQINRLVYQ